MNAPVQAGDLGTAVGLRPAMMTGFGNTFSTEAEPGALPVGQNSPQRSPLGLYAEQLSGTAFTAPRHENRRSWLYRIRPSAQHPPYRPIDSGLVRGAPFDEVPPSPNRLRWDPLPWPETPADFIDGLITVVGNEGLAVHVYRAARPMADRVFFNADGELLLVPQEGRLDLFTELGRITVGPGEIAVVPRGVRFRADPLDGRARGYVAENYGASLRLPELGPIGANGLANPQDFETPVASYEDSDRRTELVQKFCGRLWSTTLDHSPLDVVAWRGNLAPYRYDLSRFNTMGTVSFDHPDPSIFTVLTSPSDTPGVANLDLVIFPPRWMVAEHTFRPPYFHRNVMNEFMGLVHGAYDAKAEGFAPGGMSLHNCMSSHGPDAPTFKAASETELKPHKIDGALAFMFESRHVFRPTRAAVESAALQTDYDACWQAFPNNFRQGT